MFGKRRIGWLGIDVGAASVKIAQLERGRGGLQVRAKAMVSRHTPWPSEIVAESSWSSAAEIRTAASLRSEFRGRDAAIAMPMEVCDVHQIDHLQIGDPGCEHEVKRAIETLTQRPIDDLQIECWPAAGGPQPGTPAHVNALAVARLWSEQLVDDVVANSWSCHVIDGLPQTLARAISLVVPDTSTVPVAALDWGIGQATFCLVLEGSPVYVRRLKGCSLRDMLETVSSELGVQLDEAHWLLQEHGLLGSSHHPTSEMSALLGEVIAERLKQLERELTRTLTHLKSQRQTSVPQQLFLFGGGALIRGIAPHMTRCLNLETSVWSLTNPLSEHSPSDPDICLYGPALALSALAWEKP